MSRRLAPAALFVAVYLMSLPGVALAAPPSPFPAGASGIGDPYYPLDGNGGYDVQHYDLKVTYVPATDQLTGEATIVAKATQNLSAFNLDFVGMRLRSLTVNGVTARTSRSGHELTVKPRTGLTNGSIFTVVARYDGVPQTLEDFGGSGFIHTNDGAIVVGEPHVAATWFPSNDHPRDKASITFRITVPAGLEAIANGVLVSQQTSGAWSTWTWDAVEPMATYLATMAIGEFEVRDYQAAGIQYWDAIDSDLMADLVGPVDPVTGSQFLYSQVADSSYKRLIRTLDVSPGGATLRFQVNRDTEFFWDFLFVEARTAGADDWTTLPDLNGHTSQETGNCPYNYWGLHPFLEHYVTPFIEDPGDPSTPDDDFYRCTPTGTSGTWNAATGVSDGWETWTVQLANPTATTRQVEVAISYASDGSVQGRGVALDDVVVSTGIGSTSFEADGNVLDGWAAPLAGPEGSPTNENTWAPTSSLPAIPGLGASALVSFDRQPEFIAFGAANFGPYPFSAGGGIVDNVEVGFALENQTRPTYSPGFFGGPEGNDFVVVHELAHQWFGDSLAVDTWQDIWLNEGFASYAEWLWSDAQGFGTVEQIFDDFASIPADDPFWELAIGDPGTEQLFDFPVYARGAMTLQALRREVGNGPFFKILKAWASSQANGTVTTREFIDLAESISHRDLDPLFSVWLSSGKPPIGNGNNPNAGLSVKNLHAASRSLVERLHARNGQPFRDAKGVSG